MPSSQWTQDELDTLYEAWGLVRPSPEELRAKTCVSVLVNSGRNNKIDNKKFRSSNINEGNNNTAHYNLRAGDSAEVAKNEEPEEDLTTIATTSQSSMRHGGRIRTPLSLSSLSSLSMQSGYISSSSSAPSENDEIEGTSLSCEEEDAMVINNFHVRRKYSSSCYLERKLRVWNV